MFSFVQDNHIYTSGALGTNAAVIKGALRANAPSKLTVILPQSLKRQPSESQDLLNQVRTLCCRSGFWFRRIVCRIVCRVLLICAAGRPVCAWFGFGFACMKAHPKLVTRLERMVWVCKLFKVMNCTRLCVFDIHTAYI